MLTVSNVNCWIYKHICACRTVEILRIFHPCNFSNAWFSILFSALAPELIKFVNLRFAMPALSRLSQSQNSIFCQNFRHQSGVYKIGQPDVSLQSLLSERSDCYGNLIIWKYLDIFHCLPNGSTANYLEILMMIMCRISMEYVSLVKSCSVLYS